MLNNPERNSLGPEDFMLLFENSFDALLLTDTDGNIYRANSAAEELFGYSKDELYALGRNGLADMTDPNWPKALAERNKTGKFIGVLRCRKKDGTAFNCEVSCKVFKKEDGYILTSTSVKDISDRIEADKKLKAANKQMQDIIDGSPALIFVKDLEGRFIIINRRLEELLQMKNEELKGKTDFDIFPNEWAENYREHDREVIRSGKAIQLIEESDLADGVHHYFMANKFPLYDENGKLYAVCGVSADITEHKNIELQLRQSQAGLVEAQRLAHIGNWYWDIKSDKIYGSDEILRIYGLDPDKDHIPTLEEQGRKYFSPEDFEIISKAVNNALQTGKGYELDIEIIRHGQKAWITNRVEVIKDEDGQITALSGTIQDITESKVTEMKLLKALQELARSNKELEQFAYVASHDLQEPLRMVSNFAKMLSQKYKDQLDEKAEQYIGYMVDGTKRMQTLITDLLHYSRLTTRAQPFELTDLNQILEYVQTDLRMAIEEKKAMIYYENLPTVNADPVQMRQLFQNLIWNAIKFTSGEYPEVYITAQNNDDGWTISIKDNGIGIAPEFHERIFIIFQRLHEINKYSGTGIGLAVCKKIVERHGGRIWVESAEGKGSTFYFTLKYNPNST